MLMNSGEYLATIEQVKQEIKSAQYRAALHVNAGLVLLYHSIGCVINEHKEWGSKFINNLAADLRLFSSQFEIHGKICTDLSRQRICADGVCTNSVVTQCCNFGQGQRPGGTHLVHQKDR